MKEKVIEKSKACSRDATYLDSRIQASAQNQMTASREQLNPVDCLCVTTVSMDALCWLEAFLQSRLGRREIDVDISGNVKI